MTDVKPRRIGLAYNPTNEAAIELRERAAGWCRMRNIDHWASAAGEYESLIAELPTTDVLIVLGGDGTFLRAVRAVAVVDVEPATGAVRVRRFVAVDDAGRILNPLTAEGQVVGGAVQGLGAVLFEEAGGEPLDYALPTAAEVPAFATAFHESPSPLNPLGAKGIGESGTIGAPPAIANALAAVIGRHLEPPFTAAKVWAALR